MALIAAEQALGGLLSGAIKRKRNATSSGGAGRTTKQKAQNVVSGSTEVMVKVTGFSSGAGHVQAHLNYITRNGQFEMENDRGEVFSGRERVDELFDDWRKDGAIGFDNGRKYKKQRDIAHLALSMPEGTDPKAVHDAVRDFAKREFGKKHEYVFVLHTNEPHPHCHLTIKTLGHDGKRLHTNSGDLQRWREGFAEQLRKYGVDAEATPRESRALVPKRSEHVSVRHMRLGDKTHEPRTPQALAKQITEAAEQVVAKYAGKPPPEPYSVKKFREKAEKAVAKSYPVKKTRVSEQDLSANHVTQETVKKVWLNYAAELEKSGELQKYGAQTNERPNYGAINVAEQRRVQRLAAIFQSNLGKDEAHVTAAKLAGVRNLPRVAVARQARTADMLLYPNALPNMGRGDGSDTGVRRTGIGAGSAAGRAAGRANEIAGTNPMPLSDKALAGRIRAYVGTVPQLQTMHDALRKEMEAQYVTQRVAPQRATDAVTERKKGTVETVPPGKVITKDIER